jgi:hypothetical protein
MLPVRFERSVVMRTRRRRLGLVTAFAASLATLAASLTVRAADIVLDAGAGCADSGELEFQVERALGQPLAQVSSARFLVHVQPVPAGFRAELEIAEDAAAAPRGFRTLAASTCDELTQQVALAIALALGEHAVEPARAEPSGAPPSPSSRETAASAEASSELEPDTASSGPALAASAWLIGDTGTLPAMAWGLGVGAGLGWPAFELRALGTLLPERKGSVDPGDPRSAGAEIGLLAGGVMACLPLALNHAALELSACAGGELGALSGSGTGVSTPYHQRTLWAAARFDAAARWMLPHTALAIEALLTAAAPLSRDEFVLRDIGSVHRPESVLGRAALGLCYFVD